MSLKILVTGAAGFVGSNVMAIAVDRGHRVTGLDRRAGAAVDVVADVTDHAALLDHAAGRDAVIHCAAIVGPTPAKADPAMATRVNVDGTLAVLNAARAHGFRTICLSTATLYGNNPACPVNDETAVPDPVGIYDATKLMAEILCDAYRKSFAVQVASIRTSFVYGAGHSTGDYFVGRCLAGEREISAAGRDHPCEFTYVKDLALGLVQAAEAPALTHGIYNIASGLTRPRGDLAKVVTGHFPDATISLTPGNDPDRHLRGPCRIDRARADFGFSPQYTLETGIADWLRSARG